MFMRNTLVAGAALAAVSAAYAAPIVITSPNFAGNGAARTTWLAAAGISSGDVMADFESIPLGNIHNQANVYPGLTVSSSNGAANVVSGTASTGGSNPIDLQALALREGVNYTLSFSSPIDYFAFYHMDLTTMSVTVTYTDGTTSVHSHNGSGSTGNTAVFFGFYRNDALAVSSILLRGSGGDGEAGLDNLEYGNVVPEPASMAGLGMGAIWLLRRRWPRRTR